MKGAVDLYFIEENKNEQKTQFLTNQKISITSIGVEQVFGFDYIIENS